MGLALHFSLGDVVRKLREQRQLTLRELAARAQVNYTALGRLENEPDKSERRTIDRVAAALGTTTAELLAARVVTVSSDEQELLTAFQSMDARRRQLLLEVARREFAAWSQTDREQDRAATTDPLAKANGST